MGLFQEYQNTVRNHFTDYFYRYTDDSCYCSRFYNLETFTVKSFLQITTAPVGVNALRKYIYMAITDNFIALIKELNITKKRMLRNALLKAKRNR